MWVDNNPDSPFYGRMYVSWNDFVHNKWLYVTYSDDGEYWVPEIQITSTFIRNVQLTGSLGDDGTVFIAGMAEQYNRGPRTNWIYRSLDGGDTWTAIQMGPDFEGAGDRSSSCGYFSRIPPIWRHMGWGQPAVGPNGVVHYAYAGGGANPGDLSDIYYTRSTDNGDTWSDPIILNSDQAKGGAFEQWMPSASLRRLARCQFLILSLITACHSHTQALAPSGVSAAPPAANETEREKALKAQVKSIRELINQGSLDQASQAIQALKRTATKGAKERQQLVDLDATVRLFFVDFERAAELYANELRTAATQHEEDEEFWIHNKLTWLRWAEGDVAGALAECEEAGSLIQRSSLPADQKGSLRLHYLWDRAYLLVEIASAQSPLSRSAALSYAQRARSAYETEAGPNQDEKVSIGVLRAYFALRGEGNEKAARSIAQALDLSKHGDLQDLYIVALVLEAGGDPTGAEELRERIRKSQSVYMMRPIIMHRLEQDATRRKKGVHPRFKEQ